MALGTPYNVGSKAQASGVTTTVVTVGTDQNGDATTVPGTGHSVFVVAGIASGVTSVSTVTDSKSNTYTLSQKITPGDSQSIFIYECLNPGTHLAAADTVTVTWSGTTAATTSVRVIGCSGVAASSADDQTGSTSGSNAAPTATASGTLAQSSELAVAVVQSGSATGGVSSWGSGWTEVGTKLRSGTGSYMSMAVRATASTAAPTASATLAVAGAWGELLTTYKASTSGAGGLSIVQTSPLPAGQVGVAYSDQLTATGGITPYTWAVTSGSLPAGLTLEPGGGGGSSGDFVYVGANTGPQGAPTLAKFTDAYPTIGPIGCYKFFFGTLPTSWSGTLMDQITTAKPGTFCYISWNTQMTASAINQFISTIPHSVQAVGFSWQQEVENGPKMTAAAFQSGWADQAGKIQAANATTPVNLLLIPCSFTDWYQTGGDNSFIPPANVVDIYGMDFYDRKIHWVGNDMSTTPAWVRWSGFVKLLGKPIGLTEFAISGAGTDDAQNARLQADLAYLKTAFGPGGSLSPSPLQIWLWWETGWPSTDPAVQLDTMLGPKTQATWAGIAATQSGSSSTGAGGGGLLFGTPTTAATSTPTIRVTDSAGTTSSTAFSLTITSSSALAITTAATLPGATTGSAYNTILTASGGTVPYTWSLASGSLPTGLSIAGQLITGTPTVAGVYPFTIRVTDNVSATATLAVTLTVASGLTVATTSLPGGQVGVVYTATLVSAGGTAPYTWGLATGTIPDGLALDTDAGTISGTPTTAGSYPLTLRVTDAAGTIATGAQPLILAVGPSSGGLPAIGRRRFGQTAGAWIGRFVGDAWDRAPAATVVFFDALVDGNQYTDLQTTGGAPIDHVTADANGAWGEIYGPPNVLRMAVDANGGQGPRAWVDCNDAGALLAQVYTALKTLTG